MYEYLEMIRKEFDIFLVIYEEKSLSRAGDRLDKHQGALSKILAQLEKEVGYALFVRSNRGLIPTQDAAQLYQQIKYQKKQWENYKLGAVTKNNEVTGILRVGGHESVLNQFIENLSRLHQSFPALEIQYMMARSPETVRKILNHELDLALVANPQAFPELVIRTLKQEVVALFSSAKEHKKIIIYNPDLISTPVILKSLSKDTKEFIPVKDYNFAAKLAKSLKGSALLPESVAKCHKLNHQTSKTYINTKLCMIYRADRGLDKRVTAKLQYEDVK